MAAENLNLMYLSSAFRYKDKESLDSYEIKDEEFKSVKINNNIFLFSKMAVKMEARWRPRWPPKI